MELHNQNFMTNEQLIAHYEAKIHEYAEKIKEKDVEVWKSKGQHPILHEQRKFEKENLEDTMDHFNKKLAYYKSL